MIRTNGAIFDYYYFHFEFFTCYCNLFVTGVVDVLLFSIDENETEKK